MVAVFDGAFGEAAAAAATAGETVVSWRAPSVSSGAVEGGSSLDSLADLAHLLVSTNKTMCVVVVVVVAAVAAVIAGVAHVSQHGCGTCLAQETTRPPQDLCFDDLCPTRGG